MVDVGGGDTGRGAGARVGGDIGGSVARRPAHRGCRARPRACRRHGACWVSTLRRAADEPHGGEALGAIHGVDAGALVELAGDPRLAGIDLANAAFLDTETTGLMGGTGTYAFLIGTGASRTACSSCGSSSCATWPRSARSSRPWPSGWTALGLVTFNGRTFDAAPAHPLPAAPRGA
ncbi:MAG: hypothetical protein U0470_00620 [Anaerolineae bacterium]